MIIVGVQTLRTLPPADAPDAAASELAAKPPVHISIPSLKIDAPVISLGMTRTGQMEVPESPKEVGWFQMGAKPGEKGNAVLAGHRDTMLGTDAIFINLQHVQTGALIAVQDAGGQTRNFTVSDVAVYEAGNAPMEELFGKNDEALLRLITCTGWWNPLKGTYDHRLVVTAKLQP